VTIPEFSEGVRRKLSDFVRELLATKQHKPIPEEQTVGTFLSANPAFTAALRNLIQSRISARASIPEPGEPMDCKSMIARDRELQWLLRRLEDLSLAPASAPGTRAGEPPA
jgi:hypothetical protein